MNLVGGTYVPPTKNFRLGNNQYDPVDEVSLPYLCYHITEVPWMKRGLCNGKHELTHAFFVPRGQNVPKEIKALCKKCPVKGECLNYALDHNIIEGYWGGKTAGERRKIKRANYRDKLNEYYNTPVEERGDFPL